MRGQKCHVSRCSGLAHSVLTSRVETDLPQVRGGAPSLMDSLMLQPREVSWDPGKTQS